MAEYAAKIAQARKAGYSDDEITSYLGTDSSLAPKIATAKAAGYSAADILGHLETVPVAAPKAAPPKPKATFGQDVNGFMANLNKSLMIGDEVTAGAHTIGNVLTGRVPIQKAGADFNSEMGKQNALAADFNERHPIIAGGIARGLGNSAMLAVPGPKMVPGSLVGNMGRGALTAATYGEAAGLTGEGSVGERLDAGKRNALNPVGLAFGAGAGALAPRLRAPAKPNAIKPPTDADTLAAIGVSTSIPQRMGRAAKGLEDIAKRFPIIGQAIGGFNDRQIGQLNRGVGLMALEPVGLTLPKDIKPGFDMVEHIDDALGSVYDHAAKLVPKVSPSAIAPFQAELATIAERKADLPETVAKQFDAIVKSRLSRLDAPDASGALVKQIHGELGGLQAEAARKGETTLAGMLADTRRAVMGIIEHSSPEAGALVKKADKGWQIYSIMNDAAAAASNRGGVFLPGQLNTQVRSAGRGLGTNMTGKGKAPLQAVATAASRTIPDTFGNPGTANAALASGGLVGVATAPVQTASTAAALGVAATPYFLAGRKIIESLPSTAGRQQLQAAQAQLAKLAGSDPAVAAMQRAVAARLARLGGVSSSASPQPQNALARASR